MLRYVQRMWSCRYFWLSLVRIDLRARYRRSILGVGWSLVRPIVLTVTLCVVFQRLFHRADTWTFAPYLLSGLILWDYITTATRQGCQCFFQGESYIRQHPTPAAIFPLRIALGETIHFLLALVVLIGLTWYVKGPGANLPVLLSLVPTLLLLFLLAWSLAGIAGFANVYFQDTQHLCDVGFQMFFYATPIVYELKDLGAGRLYWTVANCNPLVPFLELLRQPLLYGRLPAMETYTTASLVVFVITGFAVVLCRQLQKRLIFQL